MLKVLEEINTVSELSLEESFLKNVIFVVEYVIHWLHNVQKKIVDAQCQYEFKLIMI